MAKKSSNRCEGCDKNLTAKQKKIAKRLGADKVLCNKCTKGTKLWQAYQQVKKRHAETFRRLRDQ